MKFSGYSFPHPVLGLNDDIEVNIPVEPVVSYNDVSDKDNFILTIEYGLDNEDLALLLKNGKAKFLCEATCTATLFRQSFLSSETRQVIKIPKNTVRERIDLVFLIVACESLIGYKNSKAHQDFIGYSFDIDEGDVLAFLGEAFFIAEINYQKLKAVSSFLEVVRGENEKGDFNIILDNPKVQIQLSKEDFFHFGLEGIGNNPKYASTFHSSVVLPSLIHALYQYVRNKEDLREYAWAKILEFRLENDEDLKGLQLEEDTVIKVAQVILGLPVHRLLEDIFIEIQNNTDDDE